MIIVVALLGCLETKADENVFGYVTGADTLPKGSWELYQWLTYRSQKANGTYSAIDARTEIEHGITEQFTASLYLNFRQHAIKGAAPTDPGTGLPEYEDRDTGLNFQGVQAAFKYNFLSTYKDAFGFSLYLEPGYSRIFKITGQSQDEFSLEMKLIFQKDFLEGLLIWALNVTPEHEVRKFEGGDWEKELAVEVTSGLSYRFIPKWFGSVEARYHSEYPEYGAREHYAVFLGPSVHYGDEKWWFTYTWLPQLFGGPTEIPGSGQLHLGEHEKSESRLKVGYNF